jgi:hypothetical protein
LDRDDRYHTAAVEIIKTKKIVIPVTVLPEALGLVDASLVILAERYQIKRILTLDRRHFNSIKTDRLDYLELLP